MLIVIAIATYVYLADYYAMWETFPHRQIFLR